MKIGYRRWSRPVGLSPDEKFKISGWFEKRLAFLKMLQDRGHFVTMLSGETKESKKYHETHGRTIISCQVENLDILFIEVSNKNVFQNYKVIAESVEIMNRATCPVILLWDDPELKMEVRVSQNSPLPKLFPKSRDYTVWVNAENIEGNQEKLEKTLFPRTGGIPHDSVKFEFFPFGALLQYGEEPSVFRENALVYIGGHSGGRLTVLQSIIAKIVLKERLDIFYNPKSYPIQISGEPPRQPERKAFYGKYMANLGLQDSLHKKLGWHTGRCFHALAAGAPSLVETGTVLAKYFPNGSFENIDKGIDFIRANRQAEYKKSVALVTKLRETITNNLNKHGL